MRNQLRENAVWQRCMQTWQEIIWQREGAEVMDQIMKENGHLYGMLHTQDAEAFYEKYGFCTIGDTEKTEEAYMEKPCS